MQKSAKGLSSEHVREGIYLLANCQGQKLGEMGVLDILDVTPTILHLLELPVPEDVDGRVALELFEPMSEIAQRQIRTQNAAAEDGASIEPGRSDEDVIEDRLRSLGYIE